MLGWTKHDDDAPDTWTPDRQAKLRYLDRAEGDVEAAQDAWALHTRLRFTAYLVDHQRIGRDDTGR